jgi:hypothetical protein
MSEISTQISTICIERPIKNKKLEESGLRKLQKEIGWDPNLVDVMEGLLNKRHDEAHPHPLDYDELENTANELPGEEQENVKQIIKILKKLEDSV